MTLAPANVIFLWGGESGALLCAGAAANLPAGDFGACVAGGLGGKIVGPAVNDHGAANDILHAEAVREKDGEGVAAAAEERRQVPGVLGMRAVVRIEMAPNVGKGVAAVAGTAGPGMDVKGENRVAAGPLRLRQAGDMGRNQHAPAGLIKAHHAADVWVLIAAPYLGNGRWPLSDAYKLIQVTHKVTSDHCMPGQRGLLVGVSSANDRRNPGRRDGAHAS